MRGNHWPPVDSAHKGQCPRALISYLFSTRTNGWANNRYAGNLRRHCSDSVSLQCMYVVFVVNTEKNIWWNRHFVIWTQFSSPTALEVLIGVFSEKSMENLLISFHSPQQVESQYLRKHAVSCPFINWIGIPYLSSSQISFEPLMELYC